MQLWRPWIRVRVRVSELQECSSEGAERRQGGPEGWQGGEEIIRRMGVVSPESEDGVEDLRNDFGVDLSVSVDKCDE